MDLPWLIFWYSGVTFFGWMLVRSFKSGDAGASGMKLRREEEPVPFWVKILWEGFWLVLLAILPIIVLLTNG